MQYAGYLLPVDMFHVFLAWEDGKFEDEFVKSMADLELIGL